MERPPIAWVVGASRGIGAASALSLASAGYRLAISARTEPDLRSIAARAREAGAPDVIVSPASVTSTSELARTVDQIVDEWGTIDALVCSAGVSPVYVKSEALPDQEWKEIIDTNLSGLFRCCRAVFPAMKDSGGSVINISSVHGQVAGPKLAAYAASKGGIDALTHTLAVEWAPYEIRVNAIAPGYVTTAMTEGLRENARLRAGLLERIPAGRFAGVEEIASIVTFLAGQEASYITGSVVAVDGGWSAQ